MEDDDGWQMALAQHETLLTQQSRVNRGDR